MIWSFSRTTAAVLSLWLLSSVVAAAADAAALQATMERLRKVEVPSAQRILMDQVYDSAHAERCRFDLYLPKTEKPSPLVVYFHGGGWTYGTRLGIRSPLFLPVLEQLLASGVAVAAVEYRFAVDGTTVRDGVRDCFAAMAFLTANDPQGLLLPDRIAVLGDSAGGHLGLMVALADPALFLSAGDPKPVRVRGLVVWYAASDFTSAAGWSDERRVINLIARFGATRLDDPVVTLLSPVTHLKPTSPPILCVQGDGDTSVLLRQAHILEKRAAEVGAPFRLRVVRNAGHNWREAGGTIDPGKEEIQRLTAQTLIDAVRR
jgi:acetyl esterase/lipase